MPASWASAVDAGGSQAVSLQSGTSVPATCEVGDVFFDTDATAGQNIFGCTATNVWTSQDGTIGSGWTDDGSEVRLTTTTDNVRIGPTSAEAAKLMVVNDNASQLGLTVQMASLQLSEAFSVVDSAGTRQFALTGDGEIILANSERIINSTNGTIELNNSLADNVRFALPLSGTPSISAGNAASVDFADALTITGNTDRVQHTLTQNATQTDDVFVSETSGGADEFSLIPTGRLILAENGWTPAGSGPNANIIIDAAATITKDSAFDGFSAMILDSTINVDATQSSFLGLGTDFLFNSTPVYVIDSAVNNDVGNVAFRHLGTVRVSGANIGARTWATLSGLNCQENIDNAGSGTTALTVTTVRCVHVQTSGGTSLIDTGTTVTNWIGFDQENIAPSGTLTTQYGIRIADLTGGGSDYAIWLEGADTGSIVIDDDGDGDIFLGEAQDASIVFDGNSLNIDADLVTATDTIRLQTDVVITENLTSEDTGDLGWSVVNAANQACNTTCVSACVVGIDTAALGNFLGCTDATADSCLCAGAS